MLNLTKISETTVTKNPYEYMVINEVIQERDLDQIINDYPNVPGPGSHPPVLFDIKGSFKNIVDELYSKEFQEIVEDKFNLSLKNRPKMYTIRGFCKKSDGKIHPDSKSKIITCLLYLNQKVWDSQEIGGKLRILNDGHNLENYVEEISPNGGTMLLFKRENHSWHGHHSFEGQRRAIQLNWVKNNWVVWQEQGRHNFNSFIKRTFK